ncbi:hypothetical protein RYX36_026018, partial [Vicia faba]
IGLQGEDLGLSSGSVGQWNSQSNLPTNQPLTWYKVLLSICSLLTDPNPDDPKP